MFCCRVWVCILSVGFWVGDGRRFRDAAPFLCFGALRHPGARAPARLPLLRPLSLYTLDMGRDRQAKRVRARLLGLAATA